MQFYSVSSIYMLQCSILKHLLSTMPWNVLQNDAHVFSVSFPYVFLWNVVIFLYILDLNHVMVIYSTGKHSQG